MKIVLDTSVLIDHLRGTEEAVELLLETLERGDELWSSTLVRTEILAGARENERGATMRLLDSISWLDVNVAVADEAGRFAQKFLKSHPGIDTVDYVLAATTEALKARLYTRNVKHFPMFKNLQAPY